MRNKNGRAKSGLSKIATGAQSPKTQQFEFKIGMQVGIALGECHLQVQKLETTYV